MFKHCNYEKQESLDKEIEHIEHYMMKILNFNFATPTQIWIIEALSSV
jgi:hypothetical protein